MLLFISFYQVKDLIVHLIGLLYTLQIILLKSIAKTFFFYFSRIIYFFYFLMFIFFPRCTHILKVPLVIINFLFKLHVIYSYIYVYIYIYTYIYIYIWIKKHKIYKKCKYFSSFQKLCQCIIKLQTKIQITQQHNKSKLKNTE